MTSYWAATYLTKAFVNVNFKYLNFDLTKCWGHCASTIKIKVMNALSNICGSTEHAEHHEEIVNNLVLMMKECDKFSACALTSPLHTESFQHFNDNFQFFDFNKMKLFIVEKQSIPPTFTSFKQGSKYSMSELMFSIKDYDYDRVIRLIDEGDCLPGYVYKNDTALTYAIRFLIRETLNTQDIAIKLIDKFGRDCLMVDEQGVLTGIELKDAIRYKKEKVALKIIDTFNYSYPIQNIGDWTVLMSAIFNNLPNVCNKLIDTYMIKCEPSHIDLCGNTALIMACNQSYETLAIKMIETFGLDECNYYSATKDKVCAMSIAKKNGLYNFLQTVAKLQAQEKQCETNKETTTKLLETGHHLVKTLNNLTEILNEAKEVNDNNTSIYYKGVTITNLEEAIEHYLKMVSENNKDCDDFKRVITFFL